MRKIGKYIIFFALLFAGAIHAQGVIEAKVSKSTLQEGENFRLDFIATENCPLQYPDFSPFKIVGGPSQSRQQSMSVINGRVEQEFQIIYTFVLRAPDKKGVYTIDPCILKCSDQNHRSESIKIEVGESASTSQNANWFGRIQLNKNTVYVGEPLIATYKIYSRFNIADLANLEFGETRGLFKKELNPKQNLQLEQETYNGVRYFMVEMKQELMIPQYAGELEIAPFSIEAIFRRSFFDSYKDIIKSNSSTLRVKDLPSRGKPDNFNGAVGKFDYQVNVSKESLEVGEAIDLTITVKGNGNMGLFEEPKIDFPQSFEVYDPEIDESTKISHNGISGTINYNYLMVPKEPGNFEITNLSFHYFNPEKGKYETVSVDDIIIAVEGDLEAIDMLSYQPAKKDIEAKKVFKSIKTGNIKYIEYDNLLFQSKLFWILNFSPVLFALVFFFYRRKKKEDKTDVGKLAVKRLKKAHTYMKDGNLKAFYGEIENALYALLQEKLKIEGSDMNKDSIRSKLTASNNGELAEEICKLLENIEISQYSGIKSDSKAEEIAAQAKSVIMSIERNFKNT